MMEKRWIAALVGVVGVIGLAGGAAAADCENMATQADMNRCAQDNLLKADEALNAEYRRARVSMGGLGSQADMALRDAQRAWVAFRDAACKAEGLLVEGGSMQPLMVATCQTRLTEARTADLKLLSSAR